MGERHQRVADLLWRPPGKGFLRFPPNLLDGAPLVGERERYGTIHRLYAEGKLTEGQYSDLIEENRRAVWATLR